MKHLFKAAAAGTALLLLFSCSTPQRLSYLTDMAYNTDYPAPPAPEIVVQTGDCLGIMISSSTPELVTPFNLLSEDGTRLKYMVDQDGNIDFPVLGTIKVAGATLTKVRNGIAAGIRANGLIRDPIVNVTLDNFTVTVVGQVGNGVIPVKGGSINILQAIAISGSISNRSNIRDVMVVRTENGVRRSYHINLQSKDLFLNPVFYLKQNDVVYVKPQGTSLSASGQTVMSFVGAGLSLITIITNFILWSNR